MTISIVLTFILSIGAISLSSLVNFDDSLVSWVILIAAVVLVFIIISINSIKENKSNIGKLNKSIEEVRKDLNIFGRLNRLESYFDYLKMEKRGQTDILILIKIAAVIILGYIIIRAIASL